MEKLCLIEEHGGHRDAIFKKTTGFKIGVTYREKCASCTENKAKAISAKLLELNFGQIQWYFGQDIFFLHIQWYFG